MKTIPLTQGKNALVDDEDYEKLSVHKWQARLDRSGRWYAISTVRLDAKRFTLLMHRFIMGLKHGDKMQVDHKDRDATLDNRRENLRVTLNQNPHNRAIQKNNTSGYKGVTWDTQAGKWQAKIMVNRKGVHLGYFPTRELAATARDVGALKYHGEFAVTNASLGLLKKPVASVALAQAA